MALWKGGNQAGNLGRRASGEDRKAEAGESSEGDWVARDVRFGDRCQSGFEKI